MRRKILQILVIFFLLTLVVNTTRQVAKLSQAKSKFGQTIQKLEELKSGNAKLRAELEFRQTPEFVEREARNKLSLVKEGETVVILPKLENSQNQVNSKQSNLKIWLKRLFGKS